MYSPRNCRLSSRSSTMSTFSPPPCPPRFSAETYDLTGPFVPRRNIGGHGAYAKELVLQDHALSFRTVR